MGIFFAAFHAGNIVAALECIKCFLTAVWAAANFRAQADKNIHPLFFQNAWLLLHHHIMTECTDKSIFYIVWINVPEQLQIVVGSRNRTIFRSGRVIDKNWSTAIIFLL